jgi:membrane AbrB-like protein
MESIALGEAAGCDVRLLTMQQFTRIILTLSSVPILVSFWVWEPVGSSAGLVLTGQDSGLPLWEDLLIAAAVGAVGLWIGKFLPAGHLMGPLIASAAIGLSGLATLALPQWVVIIAQVVIGTALGSRFGGMQFSAIRRAIGLSILSVGFMILLSFVISLILIRVTDMSFLVSMISFAPGGVTEMSLIALSLSANPAVVTLHHLVRISLTVFMISVLAKNFRKDPKTD